MAATAAAALPQKKYFRARAHSNPLNDALFPVPIRPEDIDWASRFPAFFPQSPPHKKKRINDATDAERAATSSRSASAVDHSPASADPSTVPADPSPVPGDRAAVAESQAVSSSSTLPEDEAAAAEGGAAGSSGGEGAQAEGAPATRVPSAQDGEEQPAAAAAPAAKAPTAAGAVEKPCPPAGADGADGSPLVRFADVGCGFGGLLVKLSPMFPHTLMVGFELRDKVSEYVRERIIALRKKHRGEYGNISLIRTNAMKYLPNYFRKGQLTKLFFLFPDPHFKEKNHRRRIISTPLLAEYAYALAVGGILYTITDVEELGNWMDVHLHAHPLFEKLTDQEIAADPVVPLLSSASEEAQKVLRNGGKMYTAIYRRVECRDT